MRLSDQHIHSAASPDSQVPMRLMAEAARDHGLSMVCFTDHVDMDDDRTGRVTTQWRERLRRSQEQREEIKAHPPEGIEVRFGMELGAASHDPASAAVAAADPELDFVLGSLHNLRNEEDFYFRHYGPRYPCRELNRRYLRELIELTESKTFDVMAHVGYTARYMHRDGAEDGDITPEFFGDELTELFTRLIQQGRGIEVNVSGLRCGHTTYPTVSCLRLYRQLGGELITVGSDAHTQKDAGIGVREGYDILRALGFRYVAEYRHRKPELLPL